MSHVDEGALHAYLDGALDEYPVAEARRVREHVETCAVCADRLADERRVREEARAILELAAPVVEVPTFEELRAYVRSSQPRRTAMSVRLYRLSWAASIALALGTGWVLRGGGLAPTVPLDAAGGGAAPADMERASDFGANEAPAQTTVEEREADVATPAAEPALIAQAPASGVLAERPADVAAANTLGRAEVSQQTAAQPQADRVAPDAPSALGARSADDVVAGAGFAAPVDLLTDQRQVADARLAERLDSAARALETGRRNAPEQVLTSAVSPEPAAPAALRARAATDEVQRDEEESVSLVVPGLEVLDVLPVGQGTTFAGMRALQRLESGDTLEIVHLPEGIDPSFLPPRPPGQSELVRQRGAGWVVMRARVPESYLEALLQRLEAGR